MAQDLKIFKMGLLGIPQERIAARLGMDQQLVAYHLHKTSELKNSVNEQLERGFGVNTIAGKLGWPEASAEPEGFNINLTWLSESKKALKWSDDTMKTFLVSQYKVSPQGTLEEVIKRLTREQAEEFVNEINQRLEKQASLL